MSKRPKRPTPLPPADVLALSIEQARARLGIGRDPLYKLIRQGKLPARKLGRRTLILAADLQAYAEALPAYGE
jgi:excisionase family DNA binding protein